MESLLSLVDDVPVSALPYPSGMWNRMKYSFWRAVTPHFLRIRGWLIDAHLIHHSGRQHYRIGTLKSLGDFKAFLAYIESRGFGNHFIAWKDNDQLVSLRLFDGFERQYHLRIFKDGEVRGHYEYTPESHPIWHFFEKGIEERRAQFLDFLGDWVVVAKR